ncbi:RNA polymerase sigma factor [Sphingomonas sp. NFR15]|uniref:RNA polymerase sigma factor n=1 Tax=Sphingomonas sp. NFR15 TaxID=1566282 RepID=UPI0008821247|nr:sigma-70 family RNA polymerase sigma factor [Sphingomonas sp. NFR15]SDA35419.1 RNA polymerase sigma-70 factor, ECF subfamily [Sphingomonas sp. NFR15]
MTLATPDRALWLTKHILVHEPELRSWLKRRAMPGLDVDDVVQESYAILAGLQSVDHIHHPRIYFFEVAKSVILQSFRQSRVVAFSAIAEFDALLIPDEMPSPEAIAAGRQELGRLSELIDALPPKCREAFVLRKVRGFSQREVASAMSVSENTVEKHIGKALNLLGHVIGRGGKRRVAPSYDHEPHNADGTDRTARDRR